MDSWAEIGFANPGMFGLLVIPIALVVHYQFTQQKRYATFTLSDTKAFQKLANSKKGSLKTALFTLRVIVLCLIIIALARPQSKFKDKSITEGIDIMLVLDVSNSMKAMDFKPDRLEAARSLSKEFINLRPNDRIGLVAFAAESYTLCPLTIDHQVLLSQLDSLDYGFVNDGTAIGMGIATALSRLEKSASKSKVVILLTDGSNTAGLIDPKIAAQAAVQLGTRVYCIGVGTKGIAPFPIVLDGKTFITNQAVVMDEPMMQSIATITDGKYFRATDNQSLKQIYEEIDELEKSKLRVTSMTQVRDIYFPFVAIAILLLFIEVISRYTFLKSLP
ncbi:MAG: VWA domain-containing protein [Chitinophagales bacterium]|nr:VWA domain-containing protein [Chitinophagales bacterium]